jgi:glutamate dehydrogenase/leucine dehydrogenase
LEEVNKKLKEKIISAYEKVKEISEKEKISFKEVGYQIAVERISEARSKVK